MSLFYIIYNNTLSVVLLIGVLLCGFEAFCCATAGLKKQQLTAGLAGNHLQVRERTPMKVSPSFAEGAKKGDTHGSV